MIIIFVHLTDNGYEKYQFIYWNIFFTLLSGYVVFFREYIDKLNFYAFTKLETTASDLFVLLENLPAGVMIFNQKKEQVEFKNTEFKDKLLTEEMVSFSQFDDGR